MDPDPKVTCDQCGCSIPAGSPDALCPACLLTLAIDFEDGDLADGWENGELESGSILGDYQLRQELGSGGMGRVYLAEHRPSGREVALKILTQRLDSHEARQRFFREGRLAASINHPNSLYLYGSEEIDGHPVIVMEVADSGTLQDRLSTRGSFPVKEAVDAMLDIIDGLEAASAIGILHRDIKPSNCFYGTDGMMKVGDYGLALSYQSPEDAFATNREKVVGTPAYASPEQLTGEPVDMRADIYSVGATLFHLLAGETPFEGQDVKQVISNVLCGEPKPMEKLCPEAPAELRRIILRCLDKRKSQRYQDYQSLRNALLRFSSRAMEPATIVQRLSAGWVDYLVALFPAYAIMMLLVGGEALVARPFVNQSVTDGRYYGLLLVIGVLYFTLLEGTRGAGLGKYLKGLVVAECNNQRNPGLLKALIRSVIALGSVEAIRLPLLFMIIGSGSWTAFDVVAFVLISIISGAIPPAFSLTAKNGLTPWDRFSGSHVYQKPEGLQRPHLEGIRRWSTPVSTDRQAGPYQIADDAISDGWLAGWDPVLRRHVWLFKASAMKLSGSRRNLSRSTRLRWLQQVEYKEEKWDVFSVPDGMPLNEVLQIPAARQWSCLRHLLHDLAEEFRAGEADQSLPDELTLNQVWVTADWRIKVLEWPYPTGEHQPLHDATSLDGKLAFLSEIAQYADRKTLPSHARAMIQQIGGSKFDNLKNLASTLQTFLPRPVIVSRALRMSSELMLVAYIWLSVVVGHYHDKSAGYLMETIHTITLICLGSYALMQLLIHLGFRTSVGHSIFGLAAVPVEDAPIRRGKLLQRYGIIWGSLFVPIAMMAVFPLPIAYGTGSLGWIAIWTLGVFATLFQFPCNWLDRLTKVYVVRD